jgi:hypothetical protein
MDRDQIIKGKRMQPKDSSPQKLISPTITPKKSSVTVSLQTKNDFSLKKHRDDGSPQKAG